MEVHDAIVIGAGATGGWAAKKLTEGGLRVLVLEAGREVLPDELPTDTARSQSSAVALNVERQHIQSQMGAYFNESTAHLFVDDVDNPYTFPDERPFFWIRGRQVGGRSLMWNGVTLRFSDCEFQAGQDGYGDNWPLSYRDLKPYYDEVEEFLGVYGSYENLPNVPDGRFREPKPMTRGERQFKAAVERNWPDRRVIPTRGIPTDPSISAQWPAFTAQGSTLAVALRTGRLGIRPHAVVSHIEMERRSDRAKGVAYIDTRTGQSQEALGKVIVLCASTIESTRLLLNSATTEHPAGLGNSSGVLGCFLMDHINAFITGIVPELAGQSLEGTLAGAVGGFIPNFRNVCEKNQDFYRGYQIKVIVQRDMGRPSGDCPFLLSACGEMLPQKHNRVSINNERTDAWGVPIAHINCTIGDNERALATDALARMKEMAQAADFEVTYKTSLNRLGLMIHEVGTARMGNDPKTSVLNPFNRCWDVSNLFVTDGSCFVSSAWQNPTLTMMALTARACDHILEGFGDRRF